MEKLLIRLTAILPLELSSSKAEATGRSTLCVWPYEVTLFLQLKLIQDS